MQPATQTLRILFVCMGNICRSPAGECMLRHLAEAEDLAALLEIDSAGTIGLHTGHRPDRRMRKAGARRGITIDGAARQVTPADLEAFDLVLAADRENLEDLLALPGADRHYGTKSTCSARSPGWARIPRSPTPTTAGRRVSRSCSTCSKPAAGNCCAGSGRARSGGTEGSRVRLEVIRLQASGGTLESSVGG